MILTCTLSWLWVKSGEDNDLDLSIVDSWVRRWSEAREEGPGAERVRGVLLDMVISFDNAAE